MCARKRKKRTTKDSTEVSHSRWWNRDFYRSLFGLPQDVLLKKLLETGESSNEQFERSWEQLLEVIRSVAVLHLLSVFSVYGLTSSLTSECKQVKHDSGFFFGYPHVELTQALALQLSVEQQSFEPAPPEKVQQIWNLLIDISDAFWKKRLSKIESAKTSEEKAILMLQKQLRNYTYFVRNWGYFNRVIRISRKLYSPLDPFYRRIIGLSASELITVFENLVTQIEKALTDRQLKIKLIVKARTIRDAVFACHSQFPDPEGSPEDVLKILKGKSASLDEVKVLLISWSDLRLPDMFTFSSEELASFIGVDAESLQGALNAFSFCFGDLNGNNARMFFLDNPVWMKPIIRLSNDWYFCPMPQLFFSFVFKILDNMLMRNEKAHNAFIDRRSEFLEDEIESLFKTAFPGVEPIKNYKWQGPDAEYETDLLVQIDSYLVIVEAKSGSISWSALRGGPARAKRHIHDLLVAPAVQSERLAKRLRILQSQFDNRDSRSDDLPFDLRSIKKILRLSVTLEEFATIQSNVPALKATGWLDEEFKPAVTLTLADLEVVFDILTDTPEKLHYLVRRAELQENVKFIGPELALLGLYLQNAFNIGEVESGENVLILDEMAQSVDDYYVALEGGFSPKKPTVKST